MRLEIYVNERNSWMYLITMTDIHLEMFKTKADTSLAYFQRGHSLGYCNSQTHMILLTGNVSLYLVTL